MARKLKSYDLLTTSYFPVRPVFPVVFFFLKAIPTTDYCLPSTLYRIVTFTALAAWPLTNTSTFTSPRPMS
jgi:hypothetical protein